MRRTRGIIVTAIAVLVAAAGSAAALGSGTVRGQLKASPLFARINSPTFRRVDAWVYNLRHPVMSPAELGDGRAPERITLSDPMGLTRDRSGTIFIADRGFFGPGHVVWAVSGGKARVIAGTGRRGVAETGVPALRSSLGSPQTLSADSLGRVYLADSYNHVVVRIELDGRLTRVAGNGRPGSGGDGGPATEASLNQPYDARVDERGSVFIADYANHRIRRVTPDGVMHTVAGTGEAGNSGDGGPAAAAKLNGPYGVYPDRRYGLFIADSDNHVVRLVSADGTIRRVAGTGERGNAGDGGPATDARLDSPQTVAVDPSGRIFIGDEHNHQIRMIDTLGIVHLVLGTGKAGFSPDGTPAVSASLSDPESLVFLPDGSLLLTEAGSSRVRRLRPDGTLTTFAGGGS